MTESSELTQVTGTSDGTGGDPNARIVLVPTPVASPGSCAICGKIEDPSGFVFMGLDFEFYGTLYFCSTCTGEMARLYGYVSSIDIEAMREHIDVQNVELNTLRQAVLGLESTVDGLVADAHRRSTDRADNIRSDHGRKPTDSVPSNPVDEPNAGLPVKSPVEPVAGPTGNQPSTTGPSEQQQSIPNKPAQQQRPNDVYDTTTADELLGL